MKQTAVEWLEFRYKNNINLMDYDFEQAKEMEEKQQGYSEGEVLVLLHKRDLYNFENNSKSLQEWQTPKEWFEKFKKK